MHDSKFIDLTKKTFGDWTVLKQVSKKGGYWYWLCICSCGEEREVNGSNLRSGKSTGCGHSNHTTKTHGMSHTRPWRCYQNMKNRCFNKNVKEYKYYGGRGITVCDNWTKGFIYFWEDMKDSWKDNSTLDRIDNNKGYSKDNCRWITQIEQVNNVRNNKILELNGVKDTLPNWSRKLGISKQALSNRVYTYSWSDELALTTPVSNYNKTKEFRLKHPGYKTL